MSDLDTNTIAAGAVIGDCYEVIKALHVGQSSAVYLAEHSLTSKSVALKILLHPVERSSLERLQVEAKCLARIDSANVVRVQNMGVEPDGMPYLVMDYIEGEGLDKIIERGRINDLHRFRDLFGQACSALEDVHKCQIVHRNISPSNFLISSAAKESELLTLIGFTFARSLKDKTTEPIGEVVGNPYYMSPEQCLGEAVDHRSDIYSLGCSMFEALTGTPPFPCQSTVEAMSKHISEQPVLKLTDIPDFAPVQAVILRCLEKKPEDRFQSAAEVKLALVGQPVKTKPSGFLRGLKVWGK